MNQLSIRRFGSVVGVKTGMAARCKEHHAAAWPEVLTVIRRNNIRNYSIHLRKLADGRHYLFSYLEYFGSAFAGEMARVIADPITQRWWAECALLGSASRPRAGRSLVRHGRSFHLD
jgi:L-rhamnose mutarotase